MPSTQSSEDRRWGDHPADFNCASHADGLGFSCVTLVGELDTATAPELADALADVRSGVSVVILDLSELTFMDSTGLHVILSARKRLADAGCRLILVPGSHQVQKIFEITSTKNRFEFISASNGYYPSIVRSG